MIASQNQSKILLLGDNLAIGVLPTIGVQVTNANMPAGAICLTDSSGSRVTSATSGFTANSGKYVIVQSQGPGLPLIKSDVIDFTAGNVDVTFKNHVAPKEQVSFIGYNGTSGATPAAPTTTTAFYGGINVLDFNVTGNRQIIKEFNYTATSSDTAATIAAGLNQNMIDNVKKMGEPFYKAERVAATTSVAALTGSSTITKVTKGSKVVEVYTVTADGTGTFTASTATVTDATVISFPSTSATTFTIPVTLLGTGAGHVAIYIGTILYLVADAGTADQNGAALAASINAGSQAVATYDSSGDILTIVYRDYNSYGTPLVLTTDDDSTWTQVVVTTTVGNSTPVKYVISGTTSAAATFLLDTAWQGETQYFFDGTTATNNSGIATLNGASWGIKVTGRPKTYVPQVMRGFEKVRFTIGLGENFVPATTPVTYSIAAVDGKGTSYQIQELERFSQMNQGNRYNSYNPPTQYINNAIAYGLNWNVFSITFKTKAQHGIVNDSSFRQELLIAGVEGTNTQFSDATNGLWVLLDTLDSDADLTSWT